MLRRTLEHADRNYSDRDFNRFFRRVYQHFGSLNGYSKLDDAIDFISWLKNENPNIILGIISNTPNRSIETILPMTKLHNHFNWYVCPKDVNCEKPEPEIFEEGYNQAKFWLPDLEKNEILHIGDSYECDYCGSRAYGFQSLYLDRSYNKSVTKYQNWVKGPSFKNKSNENIENYTVKDFYGVRDLLRESPSFNFNR